MLQQFAKATFTDLASPMDPEEKVDKMDKVSLHGLPSLSLEDKEEKQLKDQDQSPSAQDIQLKAEIAEVDRATLESSSGSKSEALQEKNSQEPDLLKQFEEIDQLDETQLPLELRSLDLEKLKEYS